MNKKKFYVTTPLYYPNAKPHLGTLYTTVLADVYARWHKLLGHDVFFLTGTDEHGQKLQDMAESVKQDTKVFIDSVIPAFKDVWALYEIEYNKFLRTTDEEHKKGVVHWIKRLMDQGDIYKSTYSGQYCVGCEAFVSAATDTIKDEQGNVLCAIHKKPLQELSEESYFFRLSAYEDRLLAFYEQNHEFITPKERLQEIISFVKSGLKDLSISRKSVSWGIPFPGDPSHTIYVWADALNNYITAIGYGQSASAAQAEFNKWWPADMQIMAKDIVRFHGIYWPAFLMAAGLPLFKKLVVHGYLLVGGHKMSKSLGNACDPVTLASTYGVEQVRYYLMRHMAITQDGNFECKDLEDCINADLANNVGNLLNRTVALALANGLTTASMPTTLEPATAELKDRCADMYRFVWEEMNKGYVHVALAEIMKFVSEINAFFHAQQPWVLAKKNKELFAEVIGATCQSLYVVAIMLWPVMPKKMEELLAALGARIQLPADYDVVLRDNKWDKQFVLSKLVAPLFMKIEQKPEETQAVPSVEQQSAVQPAGSQEITIDDFAKIHLAVGTILDCQPVQGSDKLLKLEVDFADLGKRTILSGVAQHVKPEQLLGSQGVFVLNLKPRKMMGLLSHGMMLFADDGAGKVIPVTVATKIGGGSRVK